MLLEDQNLVERILDELSKYGELPQHGFIGGGAIANTVLKLKWGGEYPINDFDIFIEAEPTANQSFTPIRSNKMLFEDYNLEYGTANISIDKGSSYRILNVEREGIYNFIEISRVSDRDNRYDYNYILNGFDLNCCQIGIDLNKRKLYYTKSFENFLENKQLEVSSLYTPCHTAIRLFKKIDELNCYCDLEYNMELLSIPMTKHSSVYVNRYSFGLYFGEKYLSMYKKYYSKLKEYFTMVGFFEHKKEMWEYQNKIGCNIINMDTIENESHVVNWLNPKSSIPEDILTKWAKKSGVMWTLKPKKYSTVNEEFKKMMDSLPYESITIKKVFDFLSIKTKKAHKKKIEMISDNSKFCLRLSIIIDNFYDCDFDVSHVKEIDSFIEQDKLICLFIYKFNFNLQKSYDFIKTIKRVYNEEGEWVGNMVKNILKNRNKYLLPTYEYITKEIRIYKEKYNVKLIDPIEIDFKNLPEGVIVKELTNSIDLDWAGNKMKNCINNPGQEYDKKIKSGGVKIFIITSKNSISALELHKDSNGHFYEHQLLSTCNRNPSDYHRTIGTIIRLELNVNRIKNDIDGFESAIRVHSSLLLNLKDIKIEKNNRQLPDIRVPRDLPDNLWDDPLF